MALKGTWAISSHHGNPGPPAATTLYICFFLCHTVPWMWVSHACRRSSLDLFARASAVPGMTSRDGSGPRDNAWEWASLICGRVCVTADFMCSLPNTCQVSLMAPCLSIEAHLARSTYSPAGSLSTILRPKFFSAALPIFLSLEPAWPMSTARRWSLVGAMA